MVSISSTSYDARCMSYSSGDRMGVEGEVVRQSRIYMLPLQALTDLERGRQRGIRATQCWIILRCMCHPFNIP